MFPHHSDHKFQGCQFSRNALWKLFLKSVEQLVTRWPSPIELFVFTFFIGYIFQTADFPFPSLLPRPRPISNQTIYKQHNKHISSAVGSKG